MTTYFWISFRIPTVPICPSFTTGVYWAPCHFYFSRRCSSGKPAQRSLAGCWFHLSAGAPSLRQAMGHSPRQAIPCGFISGFLFSWPFWKANPKPSEPTSLSGTISRSMEKSLNTLEPRKTSHRNNPAPPQGPCLNKCENASESDLSGTGGQEEIVNGASQG